MRTPNYACGEYYHVFNHAIEGRDITESSHDSDRFLEALEAMNSTSIAGSLSEWRRKKEDGLLAPSEPLVSIVAYCLNPNHFHLLIEQKAEDGVSRFMQRLGTCHTNYYNTSRKRRGVLFQGKYKAVHVDNNDYLLHLGAYVNLNDRVHNIPQRAQKLVRSSWGEYTQGRTGICSKDIILGQFKDIKEFEGFAKESLTLSWQAKLDQKELRLLGA